MCGEMPEINKNLTGFAPIIGDRPVCLILGSMPGRASLEQQRYYAHPRNAFWPIVCDYLDVPAGLGYEARCAALAGAPFALWDVLRHCRRAGSLDSRIRRDSEVANDFNAFLDAHQSIRHVLFNGATAAALFKRHVPADAPQVARLQWHILPSTSPAYAAMPLSEKRDRWHAAFSECLGAGRAERGC